MTVDVGHRDAEEQRLERQIERQMGCMAGFLQLFDRQRVLTGKRHYSARRLSSYTAPAGSASPSETSEASSAYAASSFFKETHPPPSSPEPCASSTETPARMSLPLPLPVLDVKDGARTTWRIRDAPRLSLDSRAVVDAKGKLRPRDIRTSVPVSSGDQSEASEGMEDQRRSPSVVARLMGLNVLPSVGGEGGTEPDQVELRRSASESRVRRDPSCYEFADAGSFHKPPLPLPPPLKAIPVPDDEFFKNVNLAQLRLLDVKKTRPTPRTNSLPPLHQKSFFDAEDFFPEQKRSGTPYSEIEKRLRIRGIDDPAKDLETMNQVLEALQLKGLLRTKNSDHRPNGRRNAIYDYHTPIQGDTPIVIMKPASKLPRQPSIDQPPSPPRHGSSRQSASSVRRERAAADRNMRERNEQRSRSPRLSDGPSSPVLRRSPNAAGQRSTQPQRRISAVSSPRSSPKRAVPDSIPSRSPRNRRPMADAPTRERAYSPAEDDTSTSFSESSISTTSQLDFERSGRSFLLERCGKLVQSIAALSGSEQDTAAEQQPSPVSVLDPSAYLGEESSPSPSSLAKRSIDFKDLADEWEQEQGSPVGSTNHRGGIDGTATVDQDYAYVCYVLRAFDRHGDAILEKRRGGESKGICPRRGLVFDTVAEILDRKRRLSPWDAFSRSGTASGLGQDEEEVLRQVWAEVRRIRQQAAAGDDDGAEAVRDEIYSGEWVRPAAEMSDAVLQIERLIFKDLIEEAIRGLADAGEAAAKRLLPRRKLVF